MKAAILATFCALPAHAQSMSPMRGEVDSFDDNFAVRVYPANPYDHRIRIDVKVYDQQFHEIQAQVAPPDFMLAGQASRPVLVVIPFDGAHERKVRICTESVPFPGESTQIRTQICGKFLARRQ